MYSCSAELRFRRTSGHPKSSFIVVAFLVLFSGIGNSLPSGREEELEVLRWRQLEEVPDQELPFPSSSPVASYPESPAASYPEVSPTVSLRPSFADSNTPSTTPTVSDRYDSFPPSVIEERDICKECGIPAAVTDLNAIVADVEIITKTFDEDYRAALENITCPDQECQKSIKRQQDNLIGFKEVAEQTIVELKNLMCVQPSVVEQSCPFRPDEVDSETSGLQEGPQRRAQSLPFVDLITPVDGILGNVVNAILCK